MTTPFVSTVFFFFCFLSVAIVRAATNVAVLEFAGKTSGGIVRPTTSSNDSYTSVEGVTSFWKALHGSQRHLQQAGMPLVPDLFQKADSGIVIIVRGTAVDLDNLPNTGRYDQSQAFVGTMQLEGTKSQELLRTNNNKNQLLWNKEDMEEVESVEDLSVMIQKHAQKDGLSAVVLNQVDSSSVGKVDTLLSQTLQELPTLVAQLNKNVIVHLVIEEDAAVDRRRQLSSSSSTANRRRLDEERDGEQEQNGGSGDEGEGEQNENYNGYYGYGYYNAYGEWVTPYKTMFQIQYFNVVVWTAIGLFVVLLFTIYLMIYMPLEPDTLLFGESAKMVGE